MMHTKGDLWEQWIDTTLLADIEATDTAGPAPFLTDADGELTMTDALDSYRYGKNDGEYLYLIYLADEPIRSADDITPVYVGESRNIGERIRQHYKNIKSALPIDDWEDDGSWGSFSKYDHIAAVRSEAELPLYVWILDVDSLDTCPYGVETYRQELEAKLIGLIYAHAAYRPTLTNREFVPNRTLHEIGKVGRDWLDNCPLTLDTATERPEPSSCESSSGEPPSKSKLWDRWVDSNVLASVASELTADPVPLFETDDQLEVLLTDDGRLKRSQRIDELIRTEGRKCVHPGGVNEDGYEGLLYMMYQLSGGDANEPPAVVPRYIGKAEAYGKKRELSSNFVEIANERTATRSFGRWGDGDYWHVGELSMALFDGDQRKRAWATELFEQGTHRLKEEVYLWVTAWNQKQFIGPYGYSAYLAEVEPQLIGLAQAVHPEKLLNKSDVPDRAPIHHQEHLFETASRSSQTNH